MASHNFLYLQELKEQFFQKIFDEWDAKWQHFPVVATDDFTTLPSLNAFVEELHDDIDNTLRQKLSSKERLEMMISKENLRRILKNNHEIRLQSHTRNCLAYYLGYDGWQDFKEKVKSTLPQEPVAVSYVQVYQSLLPQRQSTYQLPPDSTYFIEIKEPFWQKKIFRKMMLALITCLVCVGGLYAAFHWYNNRPFTAEQLANVKFDLIEDYAKPNHNHFKIRYDVTSLNCDSVVIDYDTDLTYKYDFNQKGITYQEVHKNKIDTISHTYFKPNVWWVKLIVRNQVIRTIKKVVYTGDEWTSFEVGNNWEGRNKPLNEAVKDGILHLSPSQIDEPNAQNHFWAQHLMVKDFEIDGDSATFETRIKNRLQDGGIGCFDASISFRTDNKQGAGVSFVQDCIEYALLHVAGTDISGRKKLLKFMDLNLQEWQVVKIKLQNHWAYIYVNDKEVYRTKYKGEMGKVKVIHYNFKGSGSVDWVKLSNSYTGKVVFFDDFE
jgi:hypothetical protein